MFYIPRPEPLLIWQIQLYEGKLANAYYDKQNIKQVAFYSQRLSYLYLCFDAHDLMGNAVHNFSLN